MFLGIFYVFPVGITTLSQRKTSSFKDNHVKLFIYTRLTLTRLQMHRWLLGMHLEHADEYE